MLTRSTQKKLQVNYQYYTIKYLERLYVEEKNTKELALAIILLWKIIITFYKNDPKSL